MITTLDGMLISTFVLQLERNFGLQTSYAHQAVEMWAQAYGVKVEAVDDTHQVEQTISSSNIAQGIPATIQEDDILDSDCLNGLGGGQEWPEDY